MSAAIEPGLFPEPPRTEPPGDGPWMVGPMPRRWRYMFVGEDSEQLMIYSHVPADELSDAVSLARSAVDPEDEWDNRTRWTYAVFHDMCPHHLTWHDDCGACHILREYGPPLVTLTARADLDDAERNTPGWFPVTVVDLEG